MLAALTLCVLRYGETQHMVTKKLVDLLLGSAEVNPSLCVYRGQIAKDSILKFRTAETYLYQGCKKAI